MMKHGLLGRASLLFVLVGMTGCAGQVPTTGAGTATGGSATAPTRQLLNIGIAGGSFSSILNSLPSSIPLSRAGALQAINPAHVSTYGMFGEPSYTGGLGFGRFGAGIFGMGRLGMGGYGAFSDASQITGAYAPAFASRVGSLSYLPYGNLRFPYQQVGDTLQPFVVDRKQIPFFVEKTTLAIPQVTQVEREVDVPRAVTVDQEVTVPKLIGLQHQANVEAVVQVPTKVDVPVTVTQPAVVGVKSTVPVQTTVVERQKVVENQVNHTLAETTTVSGGVYTPMTYWR